jgi:hypothetical protein
MARVHVCTAVSGAAEKVDVNMRGWTGHSPGAILCHQSIA